MFIVLFIVVLGAILGIVFGLKKEEVPTPPVPPPVPPPVDPVFRMTMEIASDGTEVFFLFPTDGDVYDFVVDWGDGTVEPHAFTVNGTGISITHTYTLSNTYQVQITSDGMFPTVQLIASPVTSIDSFGTMGWTSLEFICAGNIYLTSVVTPTHGELDGVVSCRQAFQSCRELTSFSTEGYEHITDCYGAWTGCTKLSSFSAAGLTSAENLEYAWKGCTKLSSFSAAGLTSAENLEYAWNDCPALTTFDARPLQAVTDATDAWVDSGPFTEFLYPPEWSTDSPTGFDPGNTPGTSNPALV